MKRVTLFGLICLCILPSITEGKSAYEILCALDSEPITINPFFLTDLNSHMISNLIYRGLTSIDNSGQPVPELAYSWEVKDKGRMVIFRLKDNVYWHDGKRFSSEDVIFTYELLSSLQVPSPKKGSLGPVKEIRAQDPKTVIVTYYEPFGSAFKSWTIGILPKHLKDSVLHHASDRTPIGTGPYRLVKWRRGEFMEFESFSRFYGKLPNIKKIKLKFIPDPAIRYLELKTGRLHAAEVPLSFALDNPKENLNKYQFESFRYTCLGFNLSNPLFANEKFRKAIAYAINKEEIISVVLLGKGRISLGPYPRNVWYYDDSVKPIPYDPETAKKIFKTMNLEKVEFSISVNVENKEAQRVAELIVEQLKKIGVRVKIRLFDWQTLRHGMLEEKEFDSVILSRAYLWDPDIFDLWHSSKATKGGWNLFSFRDREVDKLLEEGRRTFDRSKRAQIYKKVQRLLYEKQACLFLYETPLLFLASKKLKGIEPSPHGFLHGIENWRIQD
ncbi:MAG: ABC transporter substrate-binding protein [Desulfobacterota bacterium]|nr:ABC transporter substrate-binding protein [Thermodesulfobacteriota bacterium]